MKKVLFLIACMSIGGAEKVLVDLVNNLDSNKYDVTVMTVYKKNIYDKNYIKVEDYFNKNIKLKYMCDNSSDIMYRLFNISLNRINNKIIHKIFIGNSYDIEIAFSEGLPTKLISSSTNRNSNKIAWLHTDSLNRTRDMKDETLFKEKIMYSNFNKIVAVSKGVAESFERLHGGFKKVYVKYNPLDIDKIINKSHEDVTIKFEKNVRFIAIGRLTEVKGHERLIEVSKRLRDDGFKFQLFIVGDGELKNKLNDMIHEYNLSETIKLLGLQNNPYKYLAKCDVLVSSSYIEGYSTVVLEAINLSIPVITTQCNGMSEIFGENECGIICDNSSNGLYDALKRVLINPHLIDEYSKQCKIRSENFKIDKIIKEIEEVL